MNKKDFFQIIPSIEAIYKMDEFGKKGVPFLFIIDYNAQNAIVLSEKNLNSSKILFDFPNASNAPKKSKRIVKNLRFDKFPVTKEEYFKKFDFIKNEIQKGNSFLTNLTLPTPISTNISLEDIFYLSEAKFKLYLQDWFVVFSPEIFVNIEKNKISSFPMKGTINAKIPDAENIILNSTKEKAEHATIVDLIRNDLSIVASDVEVKRFRYVERIKTNQSELLQVSSHIEGKLSSNYKEQLGSIIFQLLPAGSISGAPKPKTLEIIEKAENYERGFYTGVCGFFDGNNLESAVMIRFIEQTESGLIFKSGGGITFLSNPENEYEELIEKVYVPIY